MYQRIFNTMAVLTVVGVIFIGCSLPIVMTKDEPEQESRPMLKATDVMPKFYFTAPDFSLAFEVKANREKALDVMNNFQNIMDTIDSVEPELYIPPKLTYVGNFYITMYAATVEQCGNDLGITASGKKVTEDPTCWTVAVDPKVIPLGTKLVIDLDGYESVIFEASDTGGDIKNYWIDVYTDSEPLSKSFNPTYADVWIIEEE